MPISETYKKKNTKHLAGDKQYNRQIETVLLAKGIGIFLVVWSHFYSWNMPGYWLQLQKVIFKFYMPLFFIISGYLLGIKKPHISSTKEYFDLISEKAIRLLLPFITVSVIYFVLKLITGIFFEISAPLTFTSLIYHIVYPVKSFAPHLWFIAALFLVFAVFPLLKLLLRKDPLIFLGAGILALCPWPPDTYLAIAFSSLPFLAAGFCFKRVTFDRITLTINALSIACCLVIFIAFYYIQYNIAENIYLKKFDALLLGVSGSVICINISSILAEYKNRKGVRIVSMLGASSMAIYLFHPIFEGFVRILFDQVIQRGSVIFEVKALLAIAAGCIFPLLLEKYLIVEQKFMKKLILGIN
ncbi:MAG: acyltransferase [Thermodesulfovibrionales bacterium]